MIHQMGINPGQRLSDQMKRQTLWTALHNERASLRAENIDGIVVGQRSTSKI